jgi:Tfp pilus assembly protein PilN
VRPVNLIPPEDRRGERAPMRTGPLAYVVVAVLAVALLAVTATVLTENQVSDRESEKASLEAQVARAEAEAERVASFASFASLQQAREQTVSSLARSRFDWERVLRELAIVIPGDVWLTNLSASVSGEASSGSSASSSTSSAASSSAVEAIAGPSLQIQGCAAGQQAVATFIAALHDIDGITRVTVLSSDRPDAGGSGAGSEAAPTGSQGCSDRGFVARFDVVAAFDAVELETPAPAPIEPQQGAPTTPASTDPSAAETTASSNDQGQVADAQQQLRQQKDSAADKTAKGRGALNTFTPGTASAP